MCFQEYIGYACGHATIKILRPCPLTTHLHTNPICSNAAERPTQVNSMCPSCARILHVRWVEIITLEHQWMHERGVCGCPVVFPALQEPRASPGKTMGGAAAAVAAAAKGKAQAGGGAVRNATERRRQEGNGGEAVVGTRDGEKWDAARKGARNSRRWGPTEKRNGDRKAKRAEKGKSHSGDQGTENNTGGPSSSQRKSARSRGATTKTRPNDAATQHADPDTAKAAVKDMAHMPHAMAWNALAPIVQITEVDDERTEVAVRLSSMYGAEWIPDHGALHRAGRCSCLVSFDKYKPHHHVTEDDVDPLALAVPDKQLQRQQPSSSSGSSTPHNADGMSWRSSAQQPLGQHDPAGVPAARESLGYHPLVDGSGAYVDTKGVAPYAPASARQGLRYDQTMDYYPMSSANKEAYAQNPYGVPYDQYTQYTQGPYTQRSTASAQTGAYMQAQPHGEIVAIAGIPVYQQQELPLAGWPIGGGPEFGAENSHSPSWDMCQLSRPKLKKSRSWSP
jgi:hypothetical protein